MHSVNRGQRCSSASPVHRQLATGTTEGTAHPKPPVSWRSGHPGLEEEHPFSLHGHTRPPDLPEWIPGEALAKTLSWSLSTFACFRGSPCHLLKCQVLAGTSAKLGTCICPQEGSCSDPEGWARWARASGAGRAGPGDGPCLWLRPGLLRPACFPSAAL